MGMNLFQLSHLDIWEYTPRAGKKPTSNVASGVVSHVRDDIFKDKKYYYEWDGLHDGGEWEVYKKSNGVHVGVLDPQSGTWHATKKAKDGRRLIVFGVLSRSRGAVAFGPICLDIHIEKLEPNKLRLADTDQGYAIRNAIEATGIHVPEALYWNFLYGIEPTFDDLKTSLMQLTHDASEYWQHR